MKLIIQIPCYNEEDFLAETVKSLPKSVDGIESVEILVINDGSTDKTIDVARSLGVHHILDLPHVGLAKGFIQGLKYAVDLGADIIVNTDADNQYSADDIPALVAPIIEENADFVIGTRDIDSIKHFSFIKKNFQKLGSWVVRKISHTNVKDTTSGFRAFSRKAACKINVFSNYTYTLETIIQAEKANLKIAQIPIKVNDKTRESRLFSSMWEYVFKSIITIFYINILYNALRVFFVCGSIMFTAGFLILIRFFYYYISFYPEKSGHTQSLIIAAILFMLSGFFFVLGLIASLISVNRQLIEQQAYQIQEIKSRLKRGNNGSS